MIYRDDCAYDRSYVHRTDGKADDECQNKLLRLKKSSAVRRFDKSEQEKKKRKKPILLYHRREACALAEKSLCIFTFKKPYGKLVEPENEIVKIRIRFDDVLPEP